MTNISTDARDRAHDIRNCTCQTCVQNAIARMTENSTPAPKMGDSTMTEDQARERLAEMSLRAVEAERDLATLRDALRSYMGDIQIVYPELYAALPSLLTDDDCAEAGGKKP